MENKVIDLVKNIFAHARWLASLCDQYKAEIIITLIGGAVLAVIGWILKQLFSVPKKVSEVLSKNNFNDIDWKEDCVKTLGISTVMENNFPDYSDYIVVMYGSATKPDNLEPNDHDFIVLMLGVPKSDTRYMHNKGTLSDIADSSNKNDVDIVFRDYLSFLYAASAGMPYENSVIKDGVLVYGKEGYFKWLKNITKNNLFDRDFIIRMYNNKISAEKDEFYKLRTYQEEEFIDQYYIVRAGYYYITSILQLNRIKTFEKVVTQNDVVGLSKVRSLYADIEDKEVREKYVHLVESLKRNEMVEQITTDEIMSILHGINVE